MSDVSITLPYMWEPRDYQQPFWKAMFGGCKRAVPIWHRRAGKDLAAFNWAVIDMAARHPGGQWWHVWPTYEQGRKGWWDGADNKGRRFMDYIPAEMVSRKRDDMMMMELTNGSIYRVVGADDPDRLVGANPVGLIMTEYSLHNPASWDYLRPILAANDGTAIFPFTPRGTNHAHELYLNTKDREDWFTQILTIEDTGALPMSVLDDERAAGMSEELIRQEYYCSFSAPMSGAYYADMMAAAEREKRIRFVPHDPKLTTETWWDIGMDDATAIWFVQRYGGELRLIDYEEASGVYLPAWIKLVKEKPYIYGRHVAPHDIAVREWSAGGSRADVARGHGIDFDVAKRIPRAEGIDAVRRAMGTMLFDGEKCFRGIEALKTYHKRWDPVREVFSEKPAPSWANHGADAMRTGITGSRGAEKRIVPNSGKKAYDPYAASRPYRRM